MRSSITPMTRLFGALSVCVLAALPMRALARGTSGAIYGLVTDTSSVALNGATVAAGGKTATTDSTGHYTLSGVSAGTQTLTASKYLYTSASTTVSVLRRTTITSPTLKLAPNLGSIVGNVKNAATSAAVAGATVSLAGTSLTATTDASGNYTFAKSPTGSQTVTASAAGYQSASQTTSVSLASTATVNFSLTAAVITGPGSTIAWNGNSTYLFGVNYAWYNYGTDFGTGAWGKYTDWTSDCPPHAPAPGQA